MNRRLGGDASLNAPLRADGDASGEWQDWLVDESPDQEERLAESEELDNRRQLLRDAMDVLNERERRIFEARRLAEDPITLEELSTEFGVTRERVRQIEVRAFEKVQKAVKKGAKELERPAPRSRPRRVSSHRAVARKSLEGRPVAALFALVPISGIRAPAGRGSA